MKKYLLAGITGLALLACILLLYMALKRPESRAPVAESIELTAARTKRGEYLVKHVTACLGCHSKRDWNQYGAPIVGHPGAGGSCLSEKWGMPGLVCPPNITPDKSTGLGSWTDGEIMRAIREGVDRHGEALFPLMPYTAYRHLSDEDTRAITAYLRTLKRRAGEVGKTDVDFPVSFFIKLVPQPLTGPVKAPPRGETAAYGEYLATVAGCDACHTPTDDQKNPILDKRFAGGYEFRSPFGLVRSPNITPHETGIKSWSKATFIQRFHAFKDKKARVEVHPGKNTPMPWLEYAGMTAEDLGAIYTYLRTLPAVEHRVEVRPPG